MKKLLLAVLAAALVLAGCAGSASRDGIQAMGYKAEITLQPIESLGDNFSRGVNDFGFGIAGKLYGTDVNLALSPVSLELALAMTRAGAAGDTAEQMKDTLGLSALSDEEIIEACRQLMWRANTSGMEAANSVWLGDNFTYRQEFIDTCTGDFMADAYELNIPGAKDDINAWVSSKTHKTIPQLLAEEPSGDTELILCNALYYLGDWVLPFEADNTHDGDFAAPSGTVSVSFMNSDWSVPYYGNDLFTMISLQFKSESSGGRYAMALLLPAEGTGIADMLPMLDGDSFAAALSGLDEQQVSIRLPKFDFMASASLKDTLVNMGMSAAFDSNAADFSRMTEEANSLFINEVLHKCYIRVDELGAEAGAATEVGIENGAMPMSPATFYADRPFVFAIYSLEDGTIAFLGAVNNPAQH